jgi:hypothetical protein
MDVTSIDVHDVVTVVSSKKLCLTEELLEAHRLKEEVKYLRV